MTNNPKSVINSLLKEIGHDFQSMTKDLDSNLKSATPVRSGTAQKGWKNTYRGQIGKSSNYQLERNDVPYIGVLDDKNNIVNKAMRNTRRLS